MMVSSLGTVSGFLDGVVITVSSFSCWPVWQEYLYLYGKDTEDHRSEYRWRVNLIPPISAENAIVCWVIGEIVISVERSLLS
jgi:hypothetical protein